MSWPGQLGGLRGINIILSDRPLFSSHQHIQTNRESGHDARVEIETCNSGHTTRLVCYGQAERRQDVEKEKTMKKRE